MTQPKPKLEAVLTAMAEHDRARNATNDRRLQQRIATEFGAKQYAQQHALARQFGKINNWKLTSTGFQLDEFNRLQRRAHHSSFRTHQCLDHPLYYRNSYGCFAAIVGQPYGSLDKFRWELDGLAPMYNLRWCVPPHPYASIWNPGATLFIVITQRSVAEVSWLPEQVAPSESLAKYLNKEKADYEREARKYKERYGDQAAHN